MSVLPIAGVASASAPAGAAASAAPARASFGAVLRARTVPAPAFPPLHTVARVCRRHGCGGELDK